MNAIETLMHEHRAIEQVIDGLLGYAAQVETGQTGDRQELGRFVRFIREFADGCHHGKEEAILFAEMVEQGFPRQNGPLAVMFLEHDRGRQYVRALDQLAGQTADWSEAERSQLAQAARGYGELLRSHIRKEDQILYPLAASQLPAASLDKIERAFDDFEQRETGAGVHAQLHALGEQLVQRWASRQ